MNNATPKVKTRRWPMLSPRAAYGSKPITSHTLGPLFKGQSVNTPGFVLAALKHEGLVQSMADNPRCYERLDATAFIEALRETVGVGVAAKPTTKAATRKAPFTVVPKKVPAKDRPTR